MKTENAFALKNFDAAKILQRPFFKKWREDYHVGDKTDEEILLALSYAKTSSQQDLEINFDILVALIFRTADYLKFIKRHVDRLERYRRAVADKIVEDKTADVETLREKYDREQKLVSFYQLEIYSDVDTWLRERLAQAFRAVDDELKLSYRKIFADRLKLARQEKGMNQKDFGVSVGLTQRAISNYEVGIREPTLAMLARFSKKLQRPIGWFFGVN